MSEKTTVKKKIAYSYNSILRAKFRNFIKRSFRNYSLSCLLYSVGITVVRGGELFSMNTVVVFVNFFLIVMSLALMMIFASSGLLARKHGNNSNLYTFSADGIHIFNEINNQEEDLSWDWIRSYELTDRALYLQINTRKPFEIILDSDKMSREESDLIISWFEASS